MPGIGTTSSPWASTQASASWAAVTPRASASTRSRCEPDVGGESVALVPLVPRSGVARVERGRRHRPAEDPATQRRERHEADPEFAQRRQDFVLDPAVEQRVLALHGRERVHRVRPADRRRGRLGQPDVPGLARGHDLRERADGLLDRHLRVHPVQVVQVDVVPAQPRQARIDRAAHVLRPPVHLAALDDEPDFGGEHDASRSGASNGPSNCSFSPSAYTSAVSKNVTPSSSARCTVARDSSRSAVP